jgi:hypothetical protein
MTENVSRRGAEIKENIHDFVYLEDSIRRRIPRDGRHLEDWVEPCGGVKVAPSKAVRPAIFSSSAPLIRGLYRERMIQFRKQMLFTRLWSGALQFSR